MRVTIRFGDSALSTTIVIAPFRLCSRHDAPLGAAGNISTRVRSDRHVVKLSGCVIVAHTVAGGAEIRADIVATWTDVISDGLNKPKTKKRSVVGKSGAQGAYRLCGIPGGPHSRCDYNRPTRALPSFA